MNSEIIVKVGDRIIAGEGEERDTGWIERIEGDMAIVRWDQGVVTPCPLEDCEPVWAP